MSSNNENLQKILEELAVQRASANRLTTVVVPSRADTSSLPTEKVQEYLNQRRIFDDELTHDLQLQKLAR